jgi:tRNA/rRNA methyltransferase
MEKIFVLVRPEDPRNVGAAARALKTMGIDRLHLVEPCSHLCEKARLLAHGSEDILENAKVFGSLGDAIADVDLAIATTARHRRLRHRYHDCRELADIIDSKGEALGAIAVVFGPESSGLANEDLALCDLVSTVPTASLYPSINLAQAVMIYAFMVCNSRMSPIQDWRVDQRMPTDAEYRGLKGEVLKLVDRLQMPNPEPIKQHLVRALARLGYDDLYLIHGLRKRIADRLNFFERARGEQEDY